MEKTAETMPSRQIGMVYRFCYMRFSSSFIRIGTASSETILAREASANQRVS